MTEDGPHTHKGMWPQWVFVAGIIALTLYIFQDGLKYNSLTGMFPQVASVSMMAFLVPIVFMMATHKAPSPFFYDAEKSAGADAKRSAEFYIAILLAMLLFSGVVGFVLGMATFITLFLRLGAQVDWWKAIAGGAASVLFLGVISHQLTLRYPTGVMQEIVTLPWPLQ